MSLAAEKFDCHPFRVEGSLNPKAGKYLCVCVCVPVGFCLHKPADTECLFILTAALHQEKLRIRRFLAQLQLVGFRV